MWSGAGRPCRTASQDFAQSPGPILASLLLVQAACSSLWLAVACGCSQTDRADLGAGWSEPPSCRGSVRVEWHLPKWSTHGVKWVTQPVHSASFSVGGIRRSRQHVFSCGRRPGGWMPAGRPRLPRTRALVGRAVRRWVTGTRPPGCPAAADAHAARHGPPASPSLPSPCVRRRSARRCMRSSHILGPSAWARSRRTAAETFSSRLLRLLGRPCRDKPLTHTPATCLLTYPCYRPFYFTEVGVSPLGLSASEPSESTV